ncbi:PMCA-type calcium-translocating P-type ATPase [Polychytrium aggregatum]|uniref:PMCA-type calcium-translocating P-type ATPase n=1 Tax=Polychytrium aggregatum TaxID=110093 RepID=UPI0022FEA842|nr:PMCA-type calcium-translocating P-type ATPase [Polychytrium aggregatum]KAI9203842.1 PMCA-type calcium-translocating P-type ATPase [Polychytrium aggregatum]
MTFELSAADLSTIFNPSKNPEHLQTLGGIEAVVSALKIDVSQGITSSTVDERKRVFGENTLPPVVSKSLGQLMLAALSEKIMIILSISAVVSLGVGLYEDFSPSNTEGMTHWIEGFAILVAVVIVVMAASINDYQKEKQFRKLNAQKDDKVVKAIRGGETKLISVYSILVGEILVLEPGDVIVADGLVLSGLLKSDESSATGESDAIKKSPQGDCLLLSGSKILEGTGRYIVTGVGTNSFFGRIMMAMRTETEETPLQIKLDGVTENIAKLGSATALLMLLCLLIKYFITVTSTTGFGSAPGQQNATMTATAIINILISSITIVVVAVPEGLPLAVTLALAYATTKMLKDRNLVRTISACETMGNATTVCSDKTGTLTQNKMTVVRGVIGCNLHFGKADIKDIPSRVGQVEGVGFRGLDGARLLRLVIENAALNSSAFEGYNEKTGEKGFVGSKTETALLDWIVKMGSDYSQLRADPANRIVHVYPFSSERKSMTTLIMAQDGDHVVYRVFVKGASEIVLKYCSRIAILSQLDDVEPPRIEPLDENHIHDMERLIKSYAQLSLRTICMAYREWSKPEFDSWISGSIRERIREARHEEWKQKIDRQIEENGGVIIPIDDGTIDLEFQDTPLTDEEVLAHPLALAELGGCDLICTSIVGIEDPLRPGVKEAVRDCQRAGVFVRMVTGDNIITAKAIASQCGIYCRGGVIMEGAQFRNLSLEEMDAILPRLQVLARSSPTDKQLLVGRLKHLGETVAVTGDGTNDGPALKMADIGFSMGIAGTEVAKEASSIILMDDNFASIVKALEWGRCVNDAVKKFIMFQLTVNITAVVVSFISSLMDANEGSALTAVQLLWVNLIMDSLAALVYATETPSRDLLDRNPDSKAASLINISMCKMILLQSGFQIAVNLSILLAGPTLFTLPELRNAGGILNSSVLVTDPLYPIISAEKVVLKTILFNTFVFLQIFNLINCCRIDNQLNVFRNFFRNPIAIGIVIFIAIGQALIVQFGAVAFQTTPLSGVQWAACIVIGFISIPLGAIIRLIPNGIFICFRSQEASPKVLPLGLSGYQLERTSVARSNLSLVETHPHLSRTSTTTYNAIRGHKRT